MRFIGIREFRGNAAKVLESLSEENEIVITSNGKPVAILTPTDDQSLEENLSALRSARAVQAVTAIQTQSARRGTDRISTGEIEEEIRFVRREQRR